MSPEDTEIEAQLPQCGFCGSHGLLVDLREQAALIGKNYPNSNSPDVVICCGYFLAIENEEVRESLVSHLIANGARTAGTEAPKQNGGD